MRWPLAVSVILHVAIIVAATITLTAPERFRVPPQEALPVEIVNIEDVSKRVAMRKDAPRPDKEPRKKPAPPKPEKPAEKPEPKPAKEVRKATPPPPEPEPEPEPEPKPDDLAALIEKTAPAEKADKPKPPAKPKPAPKPRARPAVVRKLAALEREKHRPKAPPVKKSPEKKKDTIDEIAALLNKEDAARESPPPEADDTGTPRRGPANAAGDDRRLAATLVDLLRKKIESCWTVPAGVREGETLRVRIRFQLDGEGRVTGGPVVLNTGSHPAFAAAAQSAVRAILACQPYDFLPPDRHDLWGDVILNFDPGRMLAVN